MGRKPVYVLGTGLSHDGSACLLRDGQICVAIEKERLTRVKHDGENDAAAIRYCLDAESITLDDVSLVVQNALFGMLDRSTDWYRGPRPLHDRTPLCTISHHLAHAYSAIGTSPYDEAAILVIDGCGSGLDDCIDLDGATVPEAPAPEVRHLYFEKDSFYLYRDGTMTPLYKDFSPFGHALKVYPLYPHLTLHSIGAVYHGASKYVFSGMEDPGKLMGLSPYGRPGVYDFPIFDLRDGRVRVNYDWIARFVRPARTYEQFREHFQEYADLAYWIQHETERAVLYVVQSRRALAPVKNLCYAGGVALNVRANRRVLLESGYEDVYFQPAAGDNGIAIGCAYYGWLHVLKQARARHDGSTRLGKRYPTSDVEATISRYTDAVRYERRDDLSEEIARRLAAGQTVGWFQDGAEFGPRALGSRSILADPRRAEMRDHINAKIKFREDFRPFAPAVLRDDAATYFDCTYDSPYMILVAQTRADWRSAIPAVVHVDGSARIQTVTHDANPKLHDLLARFKELTGVSVLINTSFNRRGMPIVETPTEAIDFFLTCALDVLALDQFLVEKLPVPAVETRTVHAFFDQHLRGALERAPHSIRAIGGVFRIHIKGVHSWTIDLTQDKPTLTQGTTKRADTVAEIDEREFWRFLAAPSQEAGERLLEAGTLKLAGDLDYGLYWPAILQLK